jgi:hypothetical protein
MSKTWKCKVRKCPNVAIVHGQCLYHYSLALDKFEKQSRKAKLSDLLALAHWRWPFGI